jgi:hypothetical protein
MNRSGSHVNHENRHIIISTVLIRRGGAPSGAAAYIVMGVWWSEPPSIFLNGFDFHGKSFKTV